MSKLKYEELGSTCCGETVIDPGWTGEWLCSSCKEHCGIAYLQEISLMVLTTNGEAHHHILTYDQQEDRDNDMDERVADMVDNIYNTNECRYSYSTDNVLTFTDHSWAKLEVLWQ